MSDLIPGHQRQFAIAAQSAEGSPVAGTAEYAVPMYSGRLAPNEDRANYEVADGLDYFPGQYKTHAGGGGNPVLQAFPLSAGLIWKLHLGTDTKTGSGDPYSHALTKSATPGWATCWDARPVGDGTYIWDRYEDCWIPSVTWMYDSGQLCKISFVVQAKVVKVNVTAPTITTTETLDATGPWYTWAGGTLKREYATTPASTTVTDFRSLAITTAYDGNLVQTGSLTDTYRERKRWSLGVSATIVQTDWTSYNQTYFGGTSPSANTANSATVVVGSGDFTFAVGPAADATRTCVVALPAIEWSMEPPDIAIDGSGLQANITGVLEKTTTPITATFKNNRSTAYT